MSTPANENDAFEQWLKNKSNEAKSKLPGEYSYLAVWNTREDAKFDLDDYKKGKHDKALQILLNTHKDKAYLPREKPDVAQAFLNSFILQPTQYALLVLSVSAERAKDAMQKGELGQHVVRVIPGNMIQKTVAAYYSSTKQERASQKLPSP